MEPHLPNKSLYVIQSHGSKQVDGFSLVLDANYTSNPTCTVAGPDHKCTKKKFTMPQTTKGSLIHAGDSLTDVQLLQCMWRHSESSVVTIISSESVSSFVTGKHIVCMMVEARWQPLRVM